MIRENHSNDELWEKKSSQRHESAILHATHVETWHRASPSCRCLQHTRRIALHSRIFRSHGLSPLRPTLLVFFLLCEHATRPYMPTSGCSILLHGKRSVGNTIICAQHHSRIAHHATEAIADASSSQPTASGTNRTGTEGKREVGREMEIKTR